MTAARYPGKCEHSWRRHLDGERCGECGAVCARDEAGKIDYYSADGETEAQADAQAAREAQSVRLEKPTNAENQEPWVFATALVAAFLEDPPLALDLDAENTNREWLSSWKEGP